MSGLQHLPLGNEPSAPSTARTFVRSVLEAAGAGDDVVDTAVLVVSELVTNAVLHTDGPVAVEVRTEPGPVRIAVLDAAPTAPSVRHYSDGAMTGRGLDLVDAVCTRWGVDHQTRGKTVWAEVDEAAEVAGVEEHTASESPHTSVAAGPATGANAAHGAGDDAVVVRFLAVPVALYLSLQEHNDSVGRELALLAMPAGAGDARSDVGAELLALADAFGALGGARSTHRAAVEAGHARGDVTVDLAMSMTRSAAGGASTHGRLLEEADAYARRGELLVTPADAGVVALRRWFVAQTLAQLEHGAPPTPFPG